MTSKKIITKNLNNYGRESKATTLAETQRMSETEGQIKVHYGQYQNKGKQGDRGKYGKVRSSELKEKKIQHFESKAKEGENIFVFRCLSKAKKNSRNYDIITFQVNTTRA